eukprot:Nk52_evm21s745 gene=Nk52_evmTU21s745
MVLELESKSISGEGMQCCTIKNLPGEILEKVLLHLNPHGELQNAALVCRKWYKVCEKIVDLLQAKFRDRIMSGKLKWELKRNPEGEKPQPRWGASSVYYKNRLIVFGGLFDRTSAFNDVFSYNIMSHSWERLRPTGEGPSPRGFSTFVLINKQTALLYGGIHLYRMQERSVVFNDIYLLNLETLHWTKPRVSGEWPAKRVGHCLTWDGKRDCMYLFGGFYGCRSDVPEFLLKDIYKLDLKSWRWHKIATHGRPPVLRHNHSQALLGRNLLILCGRNGNFGDLGDTAVFDVENAEWIVKERNVGHNIACQESDFDGLFDVSLPAKWGQSIVVFRDLIMVYGGYPCSTLEEFCSAQVLTTRDLKWRMCHIEAPEPIGSDEDGITARGFYSYSVCLDRVIMFGGEEIDPGKPSLRTFDDLLVLS